MTGTLAGLQSNWPSFDGIAWTNLALTIFMMMKQSLALFEAGLMVPCRPPPVQLVCLATCCSTQVLVRFEPQALAASENSSHDPKAISPKNPRCAVGTYCDTICLYWATAGTAEAASSGSDGM